MAAPKPIKLTDDRDAWEFQEEDDAVWFERFATYYLTQTGFASVAAAWRSYQEDKNSKASDKPRKVSPNPSPEWYEASQKYIWSERRDKYLERQAEIAIQEDQKFRASLRKRTQQLVSDNLNMALTLQAASMPTKEWYAKWRDAISNDEIYAQGVAAMSSSGGDGVQNPMPLFLTPVALRDLTSLVDTASKNSMVMTGDAIQLQTILMRKQAEMELLEAQQQTSGSIADDIIAEAEAMESSGSDDGGEHG